jgi:hypothetical protein
MLYDVWETDPKTDGYCIVKLLAEGIEYDAACEFCDAHLLEFGSATAAVVKHGARKLTAPAIPSDTGYFKGPEYLGADNRLGDEPQ